MIRRLLKNFETPRMRDVLQIFGRARVKTTSGRRIEMADGSPITVDYIMHTFKLPRDKAEAFVKRHT